MNFEKTNSSSFPCDIISQIERVEVFLQDSVNHAKELVNPGKKEAFQHCIETSKNIYQNITPLQSKINEITKHHLDHIFEEYSNREYLSAIQTMHQKFNHLSEDLKQLNQMYAEWIDPQKNQYLKSTLIRVEKIQSTLIQAMQKSEDEEKVVKNLLSNLETFGKYDLESQNHVASLIAEKFFPLFCQQITAQTVHSTPNGKEARAICVAFLTQKNPGLILDGIQTVVPAYAKKNGDEHSIIKVMRFAFQKHDDHQHLIEDGLASIKESVNNIIAFVCTSQKYEEILELLRQLGVHSKLGEQIIKELSNSLYNSIHFRNKKFPFENPIQTLEELGFAKGTPVHREILIMSALLAAQKNPVELCNHLDAFQFDWSCQDDVKALTSIARAVGVKSLQSFLWHIHKFKFDFTTQMHREILDTLITDLVDTHLNSSPKLIENQILSLPLSLELRIKIFRKYLMVQDPLAMIQKLDLYKITDPEIRLQLFLEFLDVMKRNGTTYDLEINQQITTSALIYKHFDLDRQFKAIENFAKKNWPGFTIKPLLSIIKNTRDTNSQKLDIYFLNSILLTLFQQEVTEKSMSLIHKHQLLQHLLFIHNPLIRSKLSSALIKMITNKTSENNFRELNRHRQKSITSALSNVILSISAWDAGDKAALAASIERRRNVFDNFKALYSLLNVLGNEEFNRFNTLKITNKGPKQASELPDPSAQKSNVMLAIFRSDAKVLVATLEKMQSIYDLGAINKLLSINLDNPVAIIEEVEKIFTVAFCENIPVNIDLEKFSNDFTKRFSEPRLRNLLIRYAANLNTLPSPDKEDCLNLLARVTEETLNGTFKEQRYAETGPHLQKIFAVDPSLKAKWMVNESFLLSDYLTALSGKAPSPRPDFNRLLMDSFAQNQLSRSSYPNLFGFLSSEDPSIKGEFGKQATRRAKLKTLAPEELRQAQLEKFLISLCLAKSEKKQEDYLLRCMREINLLSKFSDQFRVPPTFTNQLEECLKRITLFQQSVNFRYNGWTIEFTDNITDLYACGTDVDSCQAVDYDIEFSKCLLSYIADGKNKLLVIKDTNGIIRGRAILRILLDENEAPVLFLETIYPHVISDELSAAISDLAKRQAGRLHLPLYNNLLDLDVEYSLLESLGGRAKYEYVDSGLGVCEDSIFMSEGSLIYTPLLK